MLTLTSGETIYTGTVTGAGARGDITTATVSNRAEIFDRLTPRARLQRGCNHSVYQFGCGLLRSDWQWGCVVDSAPVSGYPFLLDISGLFRVNTAPDPSGFGTVDWFAGGWVEIGATLAAKRYTVLRSTAISSGIITLTLSKQLDPVPAVSTVFSIWPNCDRRWETCGANGPTNPEGKFDNRLNFFGHPFIPEGNPTFVKKQGTKGNTKKG